MKRLEMKYFVLNPNKRGAYGKASRAAILSYANNIVHENKKLAEDLLEWLKTIKEEMFKDDVEELYK